MKIKKTINITITVILTCFLIFLILSSYISVKYMKTGELPYIIGFSCLTVTTGSMEPYIDPGDVIIISNHNIEDLKIGDIATYIMKNGSIVTHRVIDLKSIDGEIVYLFQGDANNIPDAEWIPRDDVLGIYQLKIHKLARIVNILRSPLLIVIIISLLAFNKIAKMVKRQLVTLRQSINNKKDN